MPSDMLADRRFATHFGRESNRAGIPPNIAAEIDMAEDMSEIPIPDLQARIDAFLRRNFVEYDRRLGALSQTVPAQHGAPTDADLAQARSSGGLPCLSPKTTQSLLIGSAGAGIEDSRAELIELGAFYGWCLAKAMYLGAIKTGDGSPDDALVTFEEAIRGGDMSNRSTECVPPSTAPEQGRKRQACDGGL